MNDLMAFVVDTSKVLGMTHVRLCERPVRWSFDVNASTRVFYDGLHQEVVVLSGGQCYTSDFHSATLFDRHISIPEFRKILDAKFSPQCDFLMLQTLPTEVRILNCQGELVCYQTCRSGRIASAPARILGSYWLTVEAPTPPAFESDVVSGATITVPHGQTELFSDFMLITTQEVEFYTVVPSVAPQKAPVKSITHATAYHWFLPAAQFLLLIDARNTFQGHLISSRGVTRVARFEIDVTDSTLDKRTFYHQISLHIIYDKLYCLFVHEKRGELHLFQLDVATASMKVTCVLDLFTPGRFEISVLDNIIIVHNLHHKVPMLYDIRCNNRVPIVSPLPMEEPPAEHFTFPNSDEAEAPATPAVDEETMDEATRRTQNLKRVYPRSWFFLPPCYVLHYEKSHQGTLWSLQLHHDNVVVSWGMSQREKLLEYLIQRRGTKYLALSFLRSLAEEGVPLNEMNAFFTLLMRVNYGAIMAETRREEALEQALVTGLSPEERAAAVAAALCGNPRELSFFTSPSPTNTSPPPSAYSAAASYLFHFLSSENALSQKVPPGLVAWMMDFLPYLANSKQFNAFVSSVVATSPTAVASVVQNVVSESTPVEAVPSKRNGITAFEPVREERASELNEEDDDSENASGKSSPVANSDHCSERLSPLTLSEHGDDLGGDAAADDIDDPVSTLDALVATPGSMPRPKTLKSAAETRDRSRSGDETVDSADMRGVPRHHLLAPDRAASRNAEVSARPGWASGKSAVDKLAHPSVSRKRSSGVSAEFDPSWASKALAANVPAVDVALPIQPASPANLAPLSPTTASTPAHRAAAMLGMYAVCGQPSSVDRDRGWTDESADVANATRLVQMTMCVLHRLVFETSSVGQSNSGTTADSTTAAVAAKSLSATNTAPAVRVIDPLISSVNNASSPVSNDSADQDEFAIPTFRSSSSRLRAAALSGDAAAAAKAAQALAAASWPFYQPASVDSNASQTSPLDSLLAVPVRDMLAALWTVAPKLAKGNRVLQIRTATDASSAVSSLFGGGVAREQRFEGFLHLTQQDMYLFFFRPLLFRLGPKTVLTLLLEYMRCAVRHSAEIEFSLARLAVDLILTDRQYDLLYQLLQFHILPESLALAMTLVDKVAPLHPPALQLGLDMLYRLKAVREVASTLLSRSRPLDALRLLPCHSDVFEVPGLLPRDFLRVACEIDDKEAAAVRAEGRQLHSVGMFFSVFQYFQDRNVALLFSPEFRPEDECDIYVTRYLSMFEVPRADDPDNMVPEDE